MSAEHVELPVHEARDRFSEVVNRAAFGGEITWVTRGRNRQRAAAIVPAWVVEAYEQMLDREDARIAEQHLADIRAGRARTRSHEELWAELGTEPTQ
ncbi:antitoxin of toxin-antitoxin stability system [Carbonactinospora thermoautotrophica]|uniref:hypothetical protein n=1 Tax=Carbonactinospora thermoautotrophica TaxID=1469144 RepID=UPI00226DA92A|nr:hypothetical protein [Carbonactinospora thermoautotrophica]MCX9193148.1 antitoxin of toxin-antitoxin stability system [Carbonactinospora thermoautotrophica]